MLDSPLQEQGQMFKTGRDHRSDARLVPSGAFDRAFELVRQAHGVMERSFELVNEAKRREADIRLGRTRAG